MNKMMTGSINLTAVKELQKTNPKAFFKSDKTGVLYLNATIFVNDEPDQYGNNASISVYDSETKKSVYLGNFKMFSQNAPAQSAQPAQSIVDNNDDDLPF